MKKRKTFWVYIIEGFASVFNIWATIITVLLAILTLILAPADKNISFRWLILFFLISLFFFLLLLRIIWLIYTDTSRDMPKVKYAGQKYSEKGLLLLEPSDLYSYNSLVTIYYYKDGLEIAIGIGEVINIQQDGLIQICIEKKINVTEDLWKEILSNNAAKISSLTVKPYVPRSLMELYNE